MGPTASGKTDLAMRLFETGKYELVSVDSALVYRGLNIGSGKPTPLEQQRYPHHLIDIIEPYELFDVGQFCSTVNQLIGQIQSRGNTPLLVGGTMMYFNALQTGLSNLPASDPKIREGIQKLAIDKGWDHIYEELKKYDLSSAYQLKPNDKQRLSRALEVYLQTGIPLSKWKERRSESHKNDPKYSFLNIALVPQYSPRSVLHERIEVRFDKMLSLGLIEEVQGLCKHPSIHAALPAMRSVGYRQVLEYLDGKYSKTLMRDKAVAATRQLAKRQLTWLRGWSSLHELDLLDPNLVNKSIGLINGIKQGV